MQQTILLRKKRAKFFTSNTTCLPISDWELDECVVPPNRPVCEHTAQEQGLGRFLEKKKVNKTVDLNEKLAVSKINYVQVQYIPGQL